MEEYLRRKDATKYLKEQHGLLTSPNALAKLACLTSIGPRFRYHGRFPLYPVSELDSWAAGQLSELQCSTSSLSARRALMQKIRTKTK
ncbi:MAG: hypothetical protein FWD68_17155 [Alphaproteobacteria bacterium]|nr:hypothetical protein [Alphaproteobacteria bacterium]